MPACLRETRRSPELPLEKSPCSGQGLAAYLEARAPSHGGRVRLIVAPLPSRRDAIIGGQRIARPTVGESVSSWHRRRRPAVAARRDNRGSTDRPAAHDSDGGRRRPAGRAST